MRLVLAVPAALAALALARLLPAEGIGLGLRLALATVVLLAPGALIARAVGIFGVASALAWTLAALFAAMTAMFALGQSLAFALALLVLAAVAAAPFAWRGTTAPPAPLLFAVLALGAALGVALWYVAGPVGGDGLFHLARVRKLAELDDLSLQAVGEFRDGGLHPGYAFPLWHGFLGLVGRLAGVDPALVMRHEASVLAPLAVAIAYEAGWAVFRSRGAAIGVAAAQVALIALAPGAGGAYRALALPATAGRQLLALGALALVFEALRRPGAGTVATVAAAMLGVAIVHPTYALFLLVPLGGFLAARLALTRRDLRPAVPIAAALLAPTMAVVLWLLPVARSTASQSPAADVLAGPTHGAERYPGQVEVLDDGSVRLAPEVLGRGGAVAVAGLLCVPLAFFGARRRWGALVLGGSLAVLALVLLAPLFTALAEAVSLSQARRAAGFLPIAFAVAGGALVLAGFLRLAALPVALAAGIGLQLAYPGDFGYRLDEGGPAFAVLVAVVGGAAAVVLALFWRIGAQDAPDRLAAAAVTLFVLPVAVAGFADWEVDARAAGKQLSPGLVTALRERVPEGAVVFADVETSYRVAAFAPLYVAAAPPAHVADTEKNRPYERERDVRRFLRTGALAIPRRYGANWLVVDREHYRVRPALRPLYRDGRYSLYRLR
jgi:hypothetical protein